MKIGYISLVFWGNPPSCTETARTQRMSVLSGRMEMGRTVFNIVWMLSILCMLRYRLPHSIYVNDASPHFLHYMELIPQDLYTRR